MMTFDSLCRGRLPSPQNIIKFPNIILQKERILLRLINKHFLVKRMPTKIVLIYLSTGKLQRVAEGSVRIILIRGMKNTSFGKSKEKRKSKFKT